MRRPWFTGVYYAKKKKKTKTKNKIKKNKNKQVVENKHIAN